MPGLFDGGGGGLFGGLFGRRPPVAPGTPDPNAAYQMPRLPLAQNDAITAAAFGLMSGNTFNEGMQNAAQMIPAGLASNTAKRRDMYSIQEKNAERARQTAAMNAGIKQMSGVALTPEEQAAYAASPEIALKFYELAQKSPTDDISEYQYAVKQGFTGSFQDFQVAMKQAGATNVTVGGGKYGTIPPGMELVDGPNGAYLRQIPVENAAGQETKERKAGIVIDDIDRTLAEVRSNPNATTGLAGWAMGGLPIPSPARRVADLLQGIEANISIGTIQAMREENKTGAALGNASDKDLAILKSIYGDLKQSADPATFEYNLQRLRNTWLDLTWGAGNGPPRTEIKPPAPMNQSGGGGGGEQYPAGTIIGNGVDQQIMGSDGQWHPHAGGG